MTIRSIQLGRINAAYGLKGWVKIFSHTDPIEQIFTYTPWQLRRGGKGNQLVDKQLVLKKSKVQGKGVIALFEEFEDRTLAESLIGYEIWVDRSQLPELEEGEYYWNQLEGLRVVNESDITFGFVDHLMETGANDVMVVKPDADSVDDRERLIPFVEGEIVKSVDLEAATIVVCWESHY
ncbi:MAG: ribosome maturation factor RimM [Pseudomonadales bacterium]